MKKYSEGGDVTQHHEMATRNREVSEPKMTGKVGELKKGGKVKHMASGGHVAHHQKEGAEHGGHGNVKKNAGGHGKHGHKSFHAA